jgi:hypothetical protein
MFVHPCIYFYSFIQRLTFILFNTQGDFRIDAPDIEYLQDAVDRYTDLISKERWTPVIPLIYFLIYLVLLTTYHFIFIVILGTSPL